MRVTEKMKKLISILLCLCMLVQNCPVVAFAAGEDNLCEHHPEHTAECHYGEAVAGVECAHECGEECAEGCVHTAHDDLCGYIEAVEGHDCHYECAECANSDVIANQSADWCGNPLCSQEDAFHVTSCTQYVAPENPKCYCVEKCAEPNIWCDVCGFDYTQCGGTDRAVGYGTGWEIEETTLIVTGHLTALPEGVEYSKIEVHEGGNLDLGEADVTCDVFNYFGTISGGHFHDVHNSGTISGGIFEYDVVNDGTISGGTFTGHVSNEYYGTITDVTFWYATVSNSEYATISNAKFESNAKLAEGSIPPQSVIHSVNGKDVALTYNADLPAALGEAAAWYQGDTQVTGGSVPLNYTTYVGEYAVNTAAATNGTVSVPATAKFGQTVTVTATASEGYALDTVTVKHGKAEITVTDNAFTMPAGAVTISATFKACTHGTYENGICTLCGYECTHTGGNATCTAQAVCTTCGTGYGELAAHNFGSSETCTYGCGTRAQAMVKDFFNDNATYYYATLPEALAAAEALDSDGVGDGMGINVYPLADYAGDFTIPAGTIFFEGEGYTFSGTVTNNGIIGGGTFSGEVTNHGIIQSGTFSGEVTNHDSIEGGTFNGNVINNGDIYNIISGDIELGENFSIENNDTIDCQYHFWKDGACRLCAEACTHESYENGICTTCGKREVVTVEFDYNGGKFVAGWEEADTATYSTYRGETVTLGQDPIAHFNTNAYREGYILTGWNTEPDGTGTDYGLTGTITMEAMTLYAQWETCTHAEHTTDGCVCGLKDDRIHSFTKYVDNGDGTHDKVCTCGKVEVDNEAHTMDITTGKCVCGLEMAAASVTKSVAGGIVYIGSTTYYETLDEAIQAVSTCTAGDYATVNLLADIDLGSSCQSISSGVFTLDLNGNTLTSSSTTLDIYNSDCNVTITDSKGGGMVSGKYGVLATRSTVEISGGTVRGDIYGVYDNSGSSSTVKISGGTVHGDSNGVYANRNTVEISGGTVSGGINGVYADSSSTVTISGGTVSGSINGVYAHKNTVEISGGSISGTNNDIYTTSSTITLSLAEGKTEGATFPGGIKVGGTNLQAILGEGMAYWQGDRMIVLTEDQTEITGDVTAREACRHENGTAAYTLTADGTQHVASWSCCGADVTKDHTMDVTTGKCVCGLEMAAVSVTKSVAGGIVYIGSTTYYETLDAAIQAVSTCTAGDYATVKLLADIDLGSIRQTISSGVFTLDLNGKTISGSDSNVLEIVGGTVTIDDSAEDGRITSTHEETAEPIALRIGGGTVTVTGGTIHCSGTTAFSNAVRINSGNLTVSGGNIIDENSGSGIAALGGIVTITGGTITGNFCDIRKNDGTVTLTLADGKTVGATFPGGIKVYGIALGEILGSGMAYWQGDKMIVPADDQIEITGGDVTVREACRHENGTAAYTLTADGMQHVASWSCCGAEFTEAHTFDQNDAGEWVCDCTAKAVASVTIENLTAYYANFADAVTMWAEHGDILTLLADVSYDSTINLGVNVSRTFVGGDYTLDLGSNNIVNYGTLTIQSGTIKTQFDTALAVYGPTTINSDNAELQGKSFQIMVHKPEALSITGTGCDGWRIWNNYNTQEAPITIPEGFHLEDEDGNQLAANDKLPVWEITVIKANHVHNWSYTADGSTITATCEGTIGSCSDKEQSFTLNASDAGYSGNPVEAEVTRDGTDLTFTLHYTGTNYDSADAPTSAGDYTVTMTVGDKSVSDTFTISPKDISKVASCQFSLTQTSFVYSGKAPVLNVTGVDSSVGRYTMQEGTDYTVGIVQVNAGSHKLTVTGIGNYTGSVELDYTITAKEVSITGAVIQPVTYDPNGYTLTVTGVTFDGVVDGETLAYNAEAILGNTNAFGEQDATVTVTLDNSNYNLVTATYQTKVTINKAVATVTAAPTPNTLTYTGEGQYLISAGEANGGTMQYSTDNQTWSTTIPQGTDAGKYTVYYKVVGDENHSDTDVQYVEVEIGQLAVAEPTVTGTYTYSGKEHTVTLAGVESCMTIASGNKGTNAGNYEVQVTLDGNHQWAEGSDGKIPWSIDKAKAEISVNTDPITVTYGETVTLPTATTNFGDVVCNKKASDIVNAGTYTVTYTVAGTDNYDGDTKSITVTVNAKAITVTADALSKTYGDTDPTLTYTAQGLVNGDELTGELKRVAGENVGSYAIEQNTLTAGDNYTITYTGANLTINAKAITEADVELNGSLTYTGKELTQPITVTEGITYTVTGDKATDVGIYELTVKGTGNYTGEVKLSWSIKETAAVVGKTPTAKELTYIGAAQALVNAGTTADGKLVYSLSENGEFTDSIPTGQDAGEYTVWYYVQGDDNHSDSAKASVKVTIAKADPVIGTVGCDMALFDSTAASAVELTRTDMSVAGTLVLTDSELTAGEGTYNWKFTPEDTDNYNTITGTVVLNVTADVLEKIEASGTLEKDSYSYGDTFSIDGLTVTATYTTGATKDVTELVSFDNTLAVGQTSVKLTYQGKTCTVTGFTVAKKQLVIDRMAWDIPENAVYSGTAYNATLTGNLPEGVTVTKTGDTATNAGDYTAKAVFSLAEGYSADNYEIVNGENLTADWTIAKKNIAGATITLGTALTYNGKQQIQTVAKVEIDGLTVTYTVSGNTGTDAKGYTLTVTGNGNFEGTETKEWSIAKKNISGATITLGDSLTYNGNERTQEVTDVKIGELTVTYDVTANKQTNAGNYTLTVTGNGNFEGSATADWSIAKAKLTITANNNSITYGDIPAANGVTGTGFVSSESIEDLSGELTYSYNYEQFGNVGTYKITPSGVTSNNYEITFADGTLTVNAKAITVTADAVSKTYGDADPKLTYKVEGLVNGDELTGELKRVAGENVGDYAIEQNTLTAGNNYRLAYTGAKLTIKAKVITAADVKLNGSLTYNGKEQTQAITVTEGITYEVTGNKATNVGTYELTVKGTGNYTGSVTLDWTITKAKLTITADSKVIYIGEKLPTLTYTVSGLVGGDKLTKEPALTTNADADQAGSYTITAANADAGMNYAITYVGGTLTIMDKNTEMETKVETAALTEVPDGLKNTKFNTVEAIKQELTSRIVATSTGFVKENMAHYDVTLQFSLDGGETWILATEENFPTEGIIVTLPYPYGTNAAGYDFVVSHMFTVTSQRLGTTAGDVELPSVTETASGIRVTLKGLSPVTLAWRATEFDVKIAGTTNGTVSTNVSKATSGTEITVTVTPKYGYKMATLTVKDASGKSYAVSTDNSGKYYFTMPSADVTVTATFSKISSSTADTTNPKTGDDFQLMLWSSILSTSAIFLLAALADQKRKLIK